jgi:hypothetical protein
MRVLFLVLWLLLPIGLLAYHLGPGQSKMQMDEAALLLRQAENELAAQNYTQASLSYGKALELLPESEKNVIHATRLARAQTQMNAAELGIARTDLEALLDELTDDPESDPGLVAETRRSLANSQYYMTWLMRLEGQPRADWESEINASQQHYRLLAEQADPDDAEEVSIRKEDLESAVRLARLDLDQLQGIPIPNQ